MAYLFGKKAIPNEDVKHENKIKQNITHEFSQVLKILQQENIKSSEPIYSDAIANTICNVLEAVFLHGVKGSVTRKITSYLTGQPVDNAPSVNFWPFVKQFTHSDVVSQLNHLGQITTEVGMCRAWVRVAMNDGIMESYIDAMLADRKTLEYYYKRTAYLRDTEQPGILKMLLQGVCEFTFQLSYNSSVLNLWTTAPLIFSGLWESHLTPAAVVSSRNEEMPATIVSNVSLPGSDVSEAVKRRKQHDTPKKQYSFESSTSKMTSPSKPIIASNTNKYRNNESSFPIPETPPNTPYDVMSGFTSKDMQEIKRLTEQMCTTPSGSSHISCPDPPPPRDPILDLGLPAVVLARRGQLYDQSSRQSGSSDQGSSTTESDNLPKYIPAVDITKSSVVNVNDMSSKQKGYACDDSEPNLSPIRMPVSLAPLAASASTALATNIEIISSSNDNNLHIHAKETHSKSVFSDYDPMKDDKDGEVSQEVETFSHEYDLRSDDYNCHGIATSQQAVEVEEEIYRNTGPRNSIGNSLGVLSGWSSTFEGQRDPIAAYRLERQRTRTLAVQSYGTLLQDYTPSGFRASPTMQQVLDSLQPEEDRKEDTDADEDVTDDVSPSAEESEYEIIQPIIDPFAFCHGSSEPSDSQLLIIGDICNEQGLDMQNYQCKDCARPIGLIYGNPRVCTYDGAYYCRECHENDEYHIPSRIIYNWDFRKHKVSKRNKEFLQSIEDHPLLNIERLNPKLYDHASEMSDVMNIRTQLLYLRSYLFTCSKSVAEDFRKMLWPKEYLYDSVHLYSLVDLLQVQSGQMLQSLKKVFRLASKHIYECGLCSQKGFICEICDNPKVIYAFEVDSTFRCQICKAVYHKACKSESNPCPKCQRRVLRRSKLGDDPSAVSADTVDYACSPED